jgi:hypothetical protein
MRGKTVFFALILGLASAAGAQEAPKTANEAQMYCSGIVSTEAVPTDTYLVSSEQSNYLVTYTDGDYVYINKGSNQGAKVGDEFQVMRSIQQDPVGIQWFSWQHSLLRAMGTLWRDLGRLRVVAVQANISIAQVHSSCDYMQRGDLVRPFAERPAPTLKSEASFDRFAPASGRTLAMVVTGKDFRQQVAEGEIIYVNLGGSQGVKVGDYFRIFRYQDGEKESVYQSPGMATAVYGFGSSQVKYKYSDLPREILGEAVVLRVSPNSSTVLITYSLREIMAGSYVELE